MNIGRRGILKLIGATPAAVAVAPAVAMQSAGYQVAGLAAASGYNVDVGPSSNPVEPRVFSSLLSYFKAKESDWREQSRIVTSVDPDIAMMRLPLPTKVRMQAERNFERIRARQSNWFNDVMAREGRVRVW